MKKQEERLLHQIGGIADRYIEEAAPRAESGGITRKKAVAISALAACLCIVSILGFGMLRRGAFTDPPAVTADPFAVESTEPLPATLPPVLEITIPPVSPDTIPPEVSTPPDTIPPAIGGSHIGDALWEKYIYLADFVSKAKDTFTVREDFDTYMTPYANKKDWGYDRPCVMYYLTQSMELTREDLEVYYAAIAKQTAKLGYETIPEEVYTGLLTDSLGESMQRFKSPYAFYYEEKLYNVYEVYKLDGAGELPFDAADPAYDAVWVNILAYVNTGESTNPVNTLLRKYIEEHVPEE